MAQLDSELHLRAEPCARALDGGAAGLARREEGLVGGGRRPAPLEGLGEGRGLGEGLGLGLGEGLGLGLGEGLGLGSCIMTTPSRPAACSGASASW